MDNRVEEQRLGDPFRRMAAESPTDRDAADAVQVHWLDLADATAGDETRWLELLDAEERARAARFYREKDRLAYVAAHALMRVTLSRALGGRPESWRFMALAHGKPSLEPAMGTPLLEFNLTHTEGAVACAVAKGPPVGVDIEGPDRAGDLLSLARAYFAPTETALLEALAEEERAAAFFRLWTLKEAYVKARGDGLTLAFDRFAFSLDPIRIELPDAPPAEPSKWHFASVLLSRGHRLSVAARSDRPLRFDIRGVLPADVEHPHHNRGSTETST